MRREKVKRISQGITRRVEMRGEREVEESEENERNEERK
jgi:hypothetical protein